MVLISTIKELKNAIIKRRKKLKQTIENVVSEAIKFFSKEEIFNSLHYIRLH